MAVICRICSLHNCLILGIGPLKYSYMECLSVSGLNATVKTPMYEMPLTFVLGGWGLGFYYWEGAFLNWGFELWHFVIGVLSHDQCNSHLQGSHKTATSRASTDCQVHIRPKFSLAIWVWSAKN